MDTRRLCACSVMSNSLGSHGLQPIRDSVHGISQARILEWVAIFSSGGIFLIQGSNPCLLPLLHWQVDSLPMLHLRILHQEAESTVRCQILPPEGRNVCSQSGQQRALEDRQPCEHPGPGRFFMGKTPVHSPCVLSEKNRTTLPSLTPHFWLC